jgi:uncharacterized membrane protein YidH (DUF202 family)
MKYTQLSPSTIGEIYSLTALVLLIVGTIVVLLILIQRSDNNETTPHPK